MTGSERRRVRGMFVGLVAANFAAWAWAWFAFADHPALLGTALLAWTFGLRHAVDADHIAAIDNVVRKLMHAGGRAYDVGLYFSLGHSTVVVLAAAGIACLASGAQRLEAAQAAGGALGTAVSAGFLLVIALVNLVILRQTWGQFRRLRAGGGAATELQGTALGGPLARLFAPALRAVTRSRHMYPIGFLFGLGFDTATEVGLLGIAAAEAARGLSPWRTLVFPALFTAGMALVDSADSAAMVGVYGWAFVRPLRKLWYNLTITAASVIVALLIGGVEAGGLLAERLELHGPVWRVVAALNQDMTGMGVAVLGVFALCWGVSTLLYRRQGIEQAG